MDRQTEEWLQQTLGPAHTYFENDDEREKAADERAEAIIRAVNEAAKVQADALERGLTAIADAIRETSR